MNIFVGDITGNLRKQRVQDLVDSCVLTGGKDAVSSEDFQEVVQAITHSLCIATGINTSTGYECPEFRGEIILYLHNILDKTRNDARSVPLVDETTPLPNANDHQVGGSHYGGRAVQHWDFAAQQGYDPFQYQITKYTDRWKRKNGVTDLYKARHFLDKYVELVEQGHCLYDPGSWLDEEQGEPTANYVKQD